MAYETKVILASLAERVAIANSAEEAYGAIQRAASVEGVKLPPFSEYRSELMKERENAGKQ